MIEVLINNLPHQFSQEGTLQGILKKVEIENRRGIAIAINEEVIPKSKWANHRVRNADKITVIKATQGG
jgi:sulfur carrier protein